jgi:cysteine synthase
MNTQTRVFESILEMLPSEENPSPMVRLNKLNPIPGFPLYAKLEWLNPFGSVKDRPAWEMIRDLEEKGQLGPSRPGRGIVEPTSGNTGISLAGIAGAKGYPMRAVVPGKVPAEKKTLLKIAGAELDVVNDAMCPLPGSEDGTIGLAKTYAKASPDRYVLPNQYENPANYIAHIKTTGPEIWRQTAGRVSHIFVSLGTCGTVTGLGKYLKSKDKSIKLFAVQPTPGHDVPGLRNISELDVSKLFDPTLIDEILEIDYELAYTRAAELFSKEGLRAGPSSALIYEGARRVLERDKAELPANGVGVMIFCDDVFKYASNMAKHIPGLAPA